ncbi:Arabidopsis thaliana At4g37120/C7A10_240,related, related [Eimeria praecox]|uniref:Arabidopsis thaliana At4g37120/C7A10_240,related, related n=1 Tax=Eimeria praecox TaxID=51316 RepID=U6G1R8_9EIME|nr:Arabidopsis thaliana At4g37120/C7A10_240,related, related [Eimeria praecox]
MGPVLQALLPPETDQQEQALPVQQKEQQDEQGSSEADSLGKLLESTNKERQALAAEAAGIRKAGIRKFVETKAGPLSLEAKKDLLLTPLAMTECEAYCPKEPEVRQLFGLDRAGIHASAAGCGGARNVAEQAESVDFGGLPVVLAWHRLLQLPENALLGVASRAEANRGKSAAFINHKPFHPGNYQNQEKVWLAEQKLIEEQKRERELEERRREEVKIEELRRALRGEARAALQLQKKEEQISPAEELRRKAKEAAKLQALQRKHQEAQNRLKKLAKSTLYDEDVLTLGHSTVFGSLYSKEENKWGYKCCGSLERSAPCTANQGDGEHRTKKRKNKNAVPTQASDATASAPAKSVDAEEKETKGESPANSSVQGNEDTGGNNHVCCIKRRAKEGGVAAYVKLLAHQEEGAWQEC